MPNFAIRLNALRKTYPIPHQKAPRIAVNDLSIAVEEGGIFGFLGPNGAGKTTTIKMLLGFIKPTSGEAWLFDRPVRDDSARRRIGFLPEQPYFPKFLTAREVVMSHASFAGLTGRAARERTADCLAAVNMADNHAMPLKKCSKGMVQRIGLATALVGDPDLLILDEPASGLDPLGRKELRDLLAELKTRGKTIFLSSHLLTEMEPLCDRVAVVARGNLVALGTPEEITRTHDDVQVLIETPAAGDKLAEQLGKMPGDIHITSQGAQSTISAPRTLAYPILGVLERQSARLISVRQNRETLEDAFLRLVG